MAAAFFNCSVPRLSRTLLLAATLLASGCATVTGTATQPVSIHAVDTFDRPVEGMRCRITNAAADYVGSTPMYDVQIRRSASDLQIECRRGTLLARATAVSRGSGLLGAVLPGGTAAILIDHLSGYRYSYPNTMRLRIGEHLVFDGDAEPPARGRVELAFDTH
jgi:hypothetical protein